MKLTTCLAKRHLDTYHVGWDEQHLAVLDGLLQDVYLAGRDDKESDPATITALQAYEAIAFSKDASSPSVPLAAVRSTVASIIGPYALHPLSVARTALS